MYLTVFFHYKKDEFITKGWLHDSSPHCVRVKSKCNEKLFLLTRPVYCIHMHNISVHCCCYSLVQLNVCVEKPAWCWIMISYGGVQLIIIRCVGASKSHGCIVSRVVLFSLCHIWYSLFGFLTAFRRFHSPICAVRNNHLYTCLSLTQVCCQRVSVSCLFKLV